MGYEQLSADQPAGPRTLSSGEHVIGDLIGLDDFTYHVQAFSDSFTLHFY